MPSRKKYGYTYMLKEIRNEKDISDLVREIGFLPFFANGINGFSIEECCLPELWFSDSADGPWEWKGPVIRTGNCVYGKLFCGKAGFISREWLPDFANFRRDGYDFDTRCDEGTAPHKDIVVYDTVAQKGAVLSKELKRLGNYRKGGNTGFETVITRLQMQTYVTVSDFVYMRDKFGKPYGWGVAQYSTPEALFGYDFVTSAYKRDPRLSEEKIIAHLKSCLPFAPEEQIINLIK